MAIENTRKQPATAEEVQAAIDGAKPDEIITVAPGRIHGRLVIDKPLTLRGAGPDRTVIDGRGRGSTIAVEAEDGEVRIEEMSIVGGRGYQGGGISIDNGCTVHVVGCLIEKNEAQSGRGGGIGIDHGTLLVTECTLVDNRAFVGGGIFAGGESKVEVAATILADNFAVRGAGLAIVEGAEVDVYTCRLEGNVAEIEGHHVYTYGAHRRRPSILLSNALLGNTRSGGLSISNHVRFKSAVAIDNSAVGREVMPARMVG